MFLGSLICHQRPDRSFRPLGVQMPVCVRCAGLYFGGAAGAFVAWFTGRRKRCGIRPEIIPLRLVLLVSAVPTGMSLWAEIGALFLAGEELRAVAAAPLGASVVWGTSLVIRGEVA